MVKIEENGNSATAVKELTILPMNYGYNATPYTLKKRRRLRPWVKATGKGLVLMAATVTAMILINI